jgi:hypothetical protein
MRALIFLVFSSFLLSATASPLTPKVPGLAGVWVSLLDSNHTWPGTMTLAEGGALTLAPDGQASVKGTWVTKGKTLTMSLPEFGTSTLDWSITGQKLTLTYPNGVTEQFKPKTQKK